MPETRVVCLAPIDQKRYPGTIVERFERLFDGTSLLDVRGQLFLKDVFQDLINRIVVGEGLRGMKIRIQFMVTVGLSSDRRLLTIYLICEDVSPKQRRTVALWAKNYLLEDRTWLDGYCKGRGWLLHSIYLLSLHRGISVV